MREILELCLQIDTFAHQAYLRLAEACCDEPRLNEMLDHMSRDEAAHVSWWLDLMQAWEKGLLPDVIQNTESLTRHLRETLRSLQAAVPEDLSDLSSDEVLTLAARIEFYMLDPVFAELLDLAEPAQAERHYKSYAEHFDRLVETIEEHYEPTSLQAFLARLLRRAWQDNRRLSAFALRDPLTGLYNRRALTAHLRQWAAWAARYGRPYAVLLVDVDNLKDVNDRLGHAAGDRLLIRIADALSSVMRESDVVARYGGDEFAVLSPETDLEELQGLTTRILDSVRAIRMRQAEDQPPIEAKVSIGAAVSRDPAGSPTRSLEEMLAQADQRLYEAKKSGRDRAVQPAVLAPPLQLLR